MKFVRIAAAGVVLVASATSIGASETVTGRWALDPASCTHYVGVAAEQPLIVTDYALRWSNEACRIARMYKTGDTIHIQAQCWGEDGERSIPVSLRPHGNRLQVKWDRKASGDMRRCS